MLGYIRLNLRGLLAAATIGIACISPQMGVAQSTLQYVEVGSCISFSPLPSVPKSPNYPLTIPAFPDIGYLEYSMVLWRETCASDANRSLLLLRITPRTSQYQYRDFSPKITQNGRDFVSGDSLYVFDQIPSSGRVAGSNSPAIISIQQAASTYVLSSPFYGNSNSIPAYFDPNQAFTFEANSQDPASIIQRVNVPARGVAPTLITQTISFLAIFNRPLTSGAVALSATATSGLQVNFSSLTPTVCSVSLTTVSLISAGTCTIAANQSGNSTYSAASQVTQSFSVTSSGLQAQTISFSSITNRVLGSGSVSLTATATSGLTVTFSSTTPIVCTVASATVTLLSVGTCTTVANQAGSANFSAAPQVSQSFSVTAQSTPASDDHGNDAANATVIQPNSTTSGNIETAGDQDWFRVSLPSAGTWTIKTVGSTDTYGYTYAADGSTKIGDDDDTGGGTNFQIIETVSGPVTRYVRVEHYLTSGTGGYSLISQFVPANTTPALVFTDNFDGTSLQSAYWTPNGPGATTVSAGFANFACSATATTSGKFVVAGAPIVIESRFAGTGALRTTGIFLVDVSDGANTIQVGDTNSQGLGLYVIGSGVFNQAQIGNGTSVNGYKEYRLTIIGTSLVFQRGDTLANLTETTSATLPTSIAGKIFYLGIGTGGPDYCPGTFDWIRVSSSAVTPPNYSDMWWVGSAENGWGMSIQQHGLVQLNALYVYDTAGKPTWYVLPGGSWNSSYTTYSGAIYQPASAPLNSYSPAQFRVGAPVGNISINFTGNSTATLQYVINGVSGQKSIQRQVFGRGTSPIVVGDMWWGGTTQDGWGISITQQAGILFGAWYTYGVDGRPTWYAMTDGNWSGNTYTGTFISTLGSPWLGATYNPNQLQVVPSGTLSLTFNDPNNAVMTYTFTSGPFSGTTQSKPIVRQPY